MVFHLAIMIYDYFPSDTFEALNNICCLLYMTVSLLNQAVLRLTRKQN